MNIVERQLLSLVDLVIKNDKTQTYMIPKALHQERPVRTLNLPKTDPLSSGTGPLRIQT
jgi:hypothetical protein